MMRRKYAIAMLALLLFAGAAGAAGIALVIPGGPGTAPGVTSTAPKLTSSYLDFSGWLPTIFAALLLAFSLTSLYYMIGVALNNQRVKATAIGEFWQVVGTAVMVIVIIWILSVFGATLTSTKSLVVSPTAISKVCTNPTLSMSQFQFASSSYVYSGQVASPTNIVCNDIVEKAAQQNDPTSNIDYGLAAAYVISANMTNQTLWNLDSLYLFEGTSGWLRSFKSITTLCVGPLTDVLKPLLGALACANPLDGNKGFQIRYTYQPFTGYYFQRLTLPPVEVSLGLIFYLYFLQMVGSLIMLYWWPFLLAAGILLRTFFFTRRAGGLIIALVIVSLIIYPIMYLFEYTSLSNTNELCQYNANGIVSTGNPVAAGTTSSSGNCIQIIGVNSLPNMVIHQLPLQYSGPYNCAGSGGTAVDEGGGVILCTLTTTSTSSGSSSTCVGGTSARGCFPTSGGTTTTTTVSQKDVQYQINFFHFPNLAWVLNYYGCYPNNGNLLNMEFKFASNYLVPDQGHQDASGGFFGLYNFLFGNFASTSVSSIPIPTLISGGYGGWSCFQPQNFAAADEAVFNVYGVMAVTGFIIPLFNILMALSAIVGLSGMLGGDTNIVGLARFV